MFCKHKARNTLEIPGGHREAGEAISDTAKRELAEETGAADYAIVPVCVYSVSETEDESGKETYGMLYYADINSFEKELHSEIERVYLPDDLPDKWTCPLIQPKLIQEAVRRKAI